MVYTDKIIIAVTGWRANDDDKRMEKKKIKKKY